MLTEWLSSCRERKTLLLVQQMTTSGMPRFCVGLMLMNNYSLRKGSYVMPSIWFIYLSVGFVRRIAQKVANEFG